MDEGEGGGETDRLAGRGSRQIKSRACLFHSNESKGATHESNRNREKINDNDKKERREKDTNKCKWISRNKTNTFFIIRKR